MTRVLLLSGGVESTCLAFWSKPSLALVIDYGQVSAEGEVAAAKSVCNYLEIPLRVLRAPLDFMRRGMLSERERFYDCEHPEFWPFRNQLLVTLAATALYGEEHTELLIGSVATDAKFPDGRRAFFDQVNELLALQGATLKVECPAIEMTTAQLIETSKLPSALAGVTFSCHRSAVPCGDCPGCRKNIAALARYVGHETWES